MNIVEKSFMALAEMVTKLKPISDRADDLTLVANAITVTYEPSDKIGQKWEVKKIGDTLLSKTYVVDESYVATDEDGTYLKPYTYTDGMAIEEGMWYKFADDNIWDAKITSDTSEYSAEYFNIIE